LFAKFKGVKDDAIKEEVPITNLDTENDR